MTVQGDLFEGDEGILNRPDIGLHGANLLARWTHRFGNGSDVQLLTYYDRLVKEFDHSEYLADARKRLQTLGAQ